MSGRHLLSTTHTAFSCGQAGLGDWALIAMATTGETCGILAADLRHRHLLLIVLSLGRSWKCPWTGYVHSKVKMDISYRVLWLVTVVLEGISSQGVYVSSCHGWNRWQNSQ
ncbi:hypothetical protein GDO86_016020 [Hymenochirus boettgeri]|uniref:Uncharacterized protein n=1 Tax=Hymenochirus boettgeri TaxID=247094 RepID=A0A8T2JZJ9_9PIPI|nr:hypothetical protein GDO86_016020 [Hymenochirus boettgeri]